MEFHKQRSGLRKTITPPILVMLILSVLIFSLSASAGSYDFGNYNNTCGNTYIICDTGDKTLTGNPGVSGQNINLYGWVLANGEMRYTNTKHHNGSLSIYNTDDANDDTYYTNAVNGTNLTCVFWHAWDSIDSDSGSFPLITNDVAGGGNTIALLGLRGGTSTTKYMRNLDGAGYVDSGQSFSNVSTIWSEYILYASATNITVIINGVVNQQDTAVANTPAKSLKLYGGYNQGTTAYYADIYCWIGPPNSRPQNTETPIIPHYPTITNITAAATNDSITVSWVFLDQSDGGAEMLRNGTFIANVSYPGKSYTFSGLKNSTLYNLTAWPYNGSGVNAYANASNSILYWTNALSGEITSNEYNLTGYNMHLFNKEGLNTTSSSGIFYYLLILIFCVFFIAMTEITQIPLLATLSGITLMFYGLLICFGISILLGVMVMFCGLCYGIGRSLSFLTAS